MVSFLIRWFVTAVAVLVAARIVPGVDYHDNYAALAVTALVLGILNAFVRPLLILFTLPLNVLTLGVFILFINAFLFWLAGKIVEGFTVQGFWSAFFGALIVSIVSYLINLLLAKKEPPRSNDKVIDV